MEEELDHRRDLRRQAPVYVVCYLLWFGFCVLTVWTMLQLRNAVLGLMPVIGPWAMMGVDKFAFVLFGLVGLVWMLYLEHYLSFGVESGVFWQRAGRVAVGHAVALGLAYGLGFLTIFLA